MINTLDQFSLFAPAGNDWIEGHQPDQVGRPERMALTKVAQELKELHVSWEVGFAEAPQYPQIGLQ